MPKITCMPPTAYNRTISTIRDYPRMVCELEQLKRDAGCLKSSKYDGMPKGSSVGSGSVPPRGGDEDSVCRGHYG